jgi:Na+/melibiose symporter-like transporter
MNSPISNTVEPIKVRKANKALRVLLGTSAVMTLLFGLFSPYYVLYVQKLGGDIEVAGTSLAAFSVVSGVLILLLRNFETSIKNQRMLYILGLFLRSIVFFIYIYIASYVELIFAQVLLGISIALINPSFDAMYSKHLTVDREVSDWGNWEGITLIVSGIASLAGAYLISTYGYQIIFAGLSISSLLVAVYLVMLPKDVL